MQVQAYQAANYAAGIKNNKNQNVKFGERSIPVAKLFDIGGKTLGNNFRLLVPKIKDEFANGSPRTLEVGIRKTIFNLLTGSVKLNLKVSDQAFKKFFSGEGEHVNASCASVIKFKKENPPTLEEIEDRIAMLSEGVDKKLEQAKQFTADTADMSEQSYAVEDLRFMVTH